MQSKRLDKHSVTLRESEVKISGLSNELLEVGEELSDERKRHAEELYKQREIESTFRQQVSELRERPAEKLHEQRETESTSRQQFSVSRKRLKLSDMELCETKSKDCELQEELQKCQAELEEFKNKRSFLGRARSRLNHGSIAATDA